MNLHTELPKLIRHYEVKKTRCLTELSQLIAKIERINKKIERLVSDEQALFLILNNKKLKGEITLTTLYEFQRNEGVIKRKIADLRLQIKNTILEKETLGKEQQKVKSNLKLCNYKVEKYVLLNRECTLKSIHIQNFIEESLIEELIYGQTR